MVNLYIEGQLIDQYADESVEIVSSVLDVQDITKNTGDYSKTFTVPTSRRNNKVFKHWYNATIDGGFDARTRVSGTIDIDGVPFRNGKWLLRGVKMVKGVADSYQINFFGETASLQQILGKDVLRDLDLSAFDHPYSVTKIQEGLVSGLFNESIIYPLMSQKGMFYNSNPSVGDSSLVNIASSGGGIGLQHIDVRPSLKVIEIINAIEAKYGITFSRDFFDTTEFDELYMWLSPDLDGGALGNRTQRIDWSTTNGTWINTITDIATYVPTPGSTTDEMFVHLTFTPVSSLVDIQYTLAIRDVDSGVIIHQQVFQLLAGSTSTITMTTTISLPESRDIAFLVVPSQSFDYSATLESSLINDGVLSTMEDSSTSSNVNALSEVEISRLMPEMEVVEFIKGLIQMFKLVVIGREGGDFYVNSLDAFYRQGERYDIGRYVDYAQWDVERGEILGELDFKFVEPSTILATQFLDNNGVGYGDSKVKLKDANGEPFDGSTLTVGIPFETIVYERLTDTFTGNLNDIQIGNVIDINYAPVFTAPHLHYASKIDISAPKNNIKYSQNPTIKLDTNIWIPMTHSGVYSPAYSLLFESEQSTYTSDTLNNTLYSNHYQNYIEAIFNIKRRTMKVSAKLPIQIITRLQLNDIITIDKLDYRINNFKYNLLTGLTQLELINGFDKFESNDVILPTECFRASNLGGQYRFNIPNIENYTITSSVVGGGTPFVTDSVTRNQLILDVDAWTNIPIGEFSRTTNLTFTDTAPTIVQGDIVRNGDFADASEWYIPNGYTDGWIVGGGFAESTGIAGRRLDQTSSFDSVVGGCTYEVEYTISDWVSGEVGIWFGSSNGVHIKNSGNGTYTGTHVAGFDADDIGLVQINEPNHLNGIFIGKVSNLSITGCKRIFKEQGGMCITQVNQG